MYGLTKLKVIGNEQDWKLLLEQGVKKVMTSLRLALNTTRHTTRKMPKSTSMLAMWYRIMDVEQAQNHAS